MAENLPDKIEEQIKLLMGDVHSAERADVTTGLVANASVGSWDLAVDEAIDGPERWFAQIEGPSIYLYFEITHPRVVPDAVRFIEARRSGLGNATDGALREMPIGQLGRLPVHLLWDEEHHDRLSLMVGDLENACVRCDIGGGEIGFLLDALRQLTDSLPSDLAPQLQ
jgi:hypothetical protein